MASTVAYACTDGPGATESSRALELDIRPSYAVEPSPFAASPIDRIVLTAFDATTMDVVGMSDVSVDPAASQWQLSFGVDLGGASSRGIVVQIQLFAGTSVEWSGRSPPFVVRYGAPGPPRSIDVYRGPLANLDVASIAILGAPSQLNPGSTAQATADVTLVPGATAPPSAFWASSDPTVATVTPQGSTATITAVASGTALIIAGAGQAMDTISVEVLLRPQLTWVGGAAGGPLDWSNPDNWNPVGVPGALDDVLVDAVTFEPRFTQDGSAGNLTVQGDPTLDLAGFTLTVYGDLDGDRARSLTTVNGLVVLTGSGGLLDGAFDDLRIDGDRTLSDATEAMGDLQLNGASVVVGPHTLDVGGDLDIDGANARLVMANPAGAVNVQGNAAFSGASQSGFLTDGTLGVGGNLTATGSSPTSFAASGAHTTAFQGSGAQSVSFSNPGVAGQRFHAVTIATNAVVTMATSVAATGNVSVDGELVVPSGTTTAVSGALTLQAGSVLRVDGTLTAAGGCTNLGATIQGSGNHPCSGFNPGLGLLVAIAFDPVSRNLFIYDDFASQIHEFTTAGVQITPAIPSPPPTSNDIDLDFASQPTNVGGTDVPADVLFVFNGEVSPGVLTAIDKDDGTVLGSVALPGGNPVGGAFDASRGSVFVLDWVSDTVTEMELDTGGTLAAFPVAPTGSPAFDVFYGDVTVDPRSGNLFIVSSAQNRLRVLTPTGAFVRDFDLGALGISGMSGIGWDAATATAWITSTNGTVHRVVGLDGTAPTSRSTLNPPASTSRLEARTSQTRPSTLDLTMFDDFMFSGGSTLQEVAWQGIYCRVQPDAPAPVPVATSFTVSFHADNAGLPNTTPLQSQTFLVAEVAETFDQNLQLNCDTTSTTWGFYDYAATLASPFVAAAGTRYWLSVVAHLPSTDLYWGWRQGTPDNSGSQQLFEGQFTSYAVDRAFFLGP